MESTICVPKNVNVQHKILPSGIDIGKWKIHHRIGPILNSTETDEWIVKLGLPSLPEMVFGLNRFELFDSESSMCLSFCAEDALKLVSKEPPKDIKVAAAKAWSASNKNQVEKLRSEKNLDEEEGQNFDWTFTTHYKGTFSLVSTEGGVTSHNPYSPTIVTEGLNPMNDGIPIQKLRSTSDPILWFSHVHLFEDELHDNGISEISIKARVMGTYWFCLLRFWLRVDNVMFRVIDTRFFHDFGSKHIIRENTIMEGSWDDVNRLVEGDIKKIRDPSTFASHLKTLSVALEHIMLPSQ